jgi:hypothetical protein
MKKRSSISSRRSRRRSRRSTRRPRRRSGSNSNSKKHRISRRSRRSKRRSRSIGKTKRRTPKGTPKRTPKGTSGKWKKILLGTAGVVGAGLAVKNMRTNYNKNFNYEEAGLISSGKPVFENITNPEEIFKVRGKTYLSNKQKIQSPGILYDTLDMKVIKDKELLANISSRENLTHVNGNDTGLPDYIIINIQLLPHDSVNYSVVLYYKIKDSTIAAAKNPGSNPDLDQAINIFKNYMANVDKPKSSPEYKKYVYERFKIIQNIVDSGTLDISKGAIDSTGINGKPSVYENDITMYKNGKSLEADLRIKLEGAKGFVVKSFLALKGTSIQEYYDKTGKININVGFLIEGKKEDELPEVLLGETKVLGLELIPANTVPFFTDRQDTRLVKIDVLHPFDKYSIGPGPENRQKMLAIMDPKTVEYGTAYTEQIETILRSLKNGGGVVDIELPDKVRDSRCSGIISSKCSESENRKFFMFARYFYYTNCFNKNFSLSSDTIQCIAAPKEGYANDPKYIAMGTCFANERIYNLYECTNGGIKTYRFGFSIQNALDNINTDKPKNFTKDLVDRIYQFNTGLFGGNKHILCISLLTPCNTAVCKAVNVGSKALPKEAYFSFQENSIIETEKVELLKLNKANIFLNVPLSSSKYGILFNGGSKSENADEFNINVNGGENTFRTLVDIAIKYYDHYSDTHILCYHCKSGKDRTSVCDAIVQATIYYLRTHKNDRPAEMYENIRKLSRYFLFYGYIITFYSTGIAGIKMNNIPVAKHILDQEDYKFFLGNSSKSRS